MPYPPLFTAARRAIADFRESNSYMAIDVTAPRRLRDLHLLDIILVIVAQVKALLISPYLFGQSDASIMHMLKWVERPFLVFAFWLAEITLPFARMAKRAGVESRDEVLQSREPQRGIAVRVHEAQNLGQGAPLILWFHGGGLFLGSAKGEDVLARYFAARLGATVVSVEYRLTPEHAWPSALDDCVDAARAAARRWPSRPILLAGMSAGGYYAIQLALALAQAEQEAAPASAGACLDVRGHVAIAPMVGPFSHFESVGSAWTLALFPHRAIHFGWAKLMRSLPLPHLWDWRVSALLASDAQLKSTSPGIVTFHHYDTLCDEGRLYAERLQAVGRLHAAARMPYPHGSGIGMGHVLGWAASEMQALLDAEAAHDPPGRMVG